VAFEALKANRLTSLASLSASKDLLVPFIASGTCSFILFFVTKDDKIGFQLKPLRSKGGLSLQRKLPLACSYGV
jgi:hypothetical protein